MYVIVKNIKQDNGLELPVIVLNGHSEIWEFSSEEEANDMVEIFNKNSYSGKNSYEVKKV
jgi:hypothetical protein